MAVAQDLGDYYRVPADNRDLNYALYFSEGQSALSGIEDFNSHNAPRLDVEGMCTLLRKIDCVQAALRGELVQP
jgi:UDP-glucose 4-epimerase